MQSALSSVQGEAHCVPMDLSELAPWKLEIGKGTAKGLEL